MLKSIIHRLKDYIKTTNPYFGAGYADVYMDQTQGIVNENGPVFPNDTDGNYFYLRLPDNIGFVQGGEYIVQDCAQGLGASAQIVLVAIVKDADEDLLLTNLVNTVQTFVANISFTGATYKKEVVTRSELSWMNGPDRDAALQRIPDDMAIVSLSFTITAPVVMNNCVVNPCKTC